MRTVIQFRKENSVRLLPDQQRIRFIRPFPPSTVTNRFRPAHSFVSLCLRRFLVSLQVIRIHFHHLIHQRPAVPQSIMCTMPPNHFMVVFAVPSIIHQSAFLRGKRAGFIHRHYILREYNSSFQFFPTGIFAFRQVDSAATLPKIRPMPNACLLCLRKGRKW